MSIFVPATATCTACGAKEAVSLAASVNADRRPDLRQAIMDGTFQAEECPSCGARMRLPAHLTYLDTDRGQWILVEDASRLEEWKAVEAEAQETYDGSFGPEAPGAAQEIGRTLRARLAFGWPALREKLLAAELGLDDVGLELLKVAILRSVDGPPLSDETELRLVAGTAEALDFQWIVSASEEVVTGLQVGRDLYGDVAGDLAGDPGPWATLRAELEGHLFVDMARIIRADAGSPGDASPALETADGR